MKYDLGKDNKKNWLIAEETFDIDHQGKCEAIFCLGNGYLGQRAALEEEYTGQYRGLLINGTFDRFDDQEVCELPNLPDLTQMTLTLDGEKFAMDRGKLENYLRVLDLETGELTRSVTWESPAGKRYRLLFRRFVSLDNEHILGSMMQVTPLNGETEIGFDSGINGQITCSGTQHFHEGVKSLLDGRIFRMQSETIQSQVTCCLHTAFTFRRDGRSFEPGIRPHIDRRIFGIKAKCSVRQNETLTVEKISTVTTTRDLNYIGETDPVSAAAGDGLAMEKAALEAGYEALFQRSAAAWRAHWDKADIRIDTDKGFDQLMVRFALYHLHIMARRGDSRMGIGAKGLTGEGYKGHSFWDTEIFILPYFILTDPEEARNLMLYRYLGLYGARKKAKENGYEGAMYPWEAAWIDDGEVTPLWGGADIVTGQPIPILTGMIEQHITADIAFAVQMYWRVTGDDAFMDSCGFEMLLDTARFWHSRITPDPGTGLGVILDVIGPDEYKEHVNNNAYTNYMAANNLKLGLWAVEALKGRSDAAAEKLKKQFDLRACERDFKASLDSLYLPKPNESGIIPQFDGYFDLKEIDLAPYKTAGQVGTIYHDYSPEQMNRMKVHKQADTLALLLLLNDLFPRDIMVKNYYYYEARTLHDSSLSKSTHCVLAADLREDETAYRFFESCGDIDLGPNMGTSDAGVHTASMGGIWQGAVYGFGGVRVVGGTLTVSPRLPEAWRSLSFPIVWQGQPLTVTADHAKAAVTNHGKKDILITLCSKPVRIPAGETAEAAL